MTKIYVQREYCGLVYNKNKIETTKITNIGKILNKLFDIYSNGLLFINYW